MSDWRTVQDKVQETMEAWKGDALALKDAIDAESRRSGGNPLVYGALAQCSKGIDEVLSKIEGVAVTLCILGLAEKYTKES